ncbi:UNVERIFIED_CONTAM: hypothetical protein Sangu_0812300 [Sesamum angustifolium]|uniref:Small acidic protein-like domain-containing protein n=1 Tax=Sesamum angustifolium TaxID=2727405 RepID=A0AAW2PW34_9LAMI
MDWSPRRERSSSPVPSRKDITNLLMISGKRMIVGASQAAVVTHINILIGHHLGTTIGMMTVADVIDMWMTMTEGDREHRSRDYMNDVDTYSHAKSDGSGHRSRDKDSYDRAGSGRRHANMEERDRDRDRERHREDKGDRYGKMDHRKGSGDHKTDRSPAYEESRGQPNDSSSRRDSSGHRLREASQRDAKELDAERSATDEKRRHENHGGFKDQHNSEPKEHSDDISTKGQDSVAKKPKISSLESTGPGAEDSLALVLSLDENTVNRNLVGTGYMSTDQKKKLLWGNKKSTAVEEGVKGDAKMEQKPDNPDVEKQREQLQMELEKQYTAGLRRRDGRTVGLGL